MSDRFYLPGDWSRSPLVLDGSEFQHLSRVLRNREGSVIELFDGKGARAAARVAKISKRSAELVLAGPIRRTERPDCQLILLVAPPKGERFRWLVEKCTELGVDRIVPLRTERSVVDPRDSKLQKLDQTVIAACKQCGRDWLMEIEPVQDLSSVLTSSSTADQTSIRLVGDVGGEPLPSGLGRFRTPDVKPKAIHLFVGPEGGFTPDELGELDSAGATRVRGGAHTLRIETAAIALAAAVVSRAGFNTCSRGL